MEPALVVAAAALVYVRRPLQRLWAQMHDRTLSERITAVMLVPVIRLVGDVAKMLGYPVGIWWRLKRR